jgi:ribosomal protein S18 acetylase RimI-like enzyme
MFELTREFFDAGSAKLSFAVIPWDTELLGKRVADVHVDCPSGISEPLDLRGAIEWLRDHNIELCSCRVPQSNIAALHGLQAIGFRYIELNYRPELSNLSDAVCVRDPALVVERAEAQDCEALASIAAQGFPFGRFHQDPRIGAAAGDKRYRQWVVNSFANPAQETRKIIAEDRLIGFFIVEHPSATEVFWNLTAIAPGLRGQSYGKRVWKTMLALEHETGATKVSTSISSHNTPVLNLYVRLGFSFPSPYVSLHWMPQ